MSEKIKCYNSDCGTVRAGKELMWQVRIVDENGAEKYVPCCSEECAYQVKHGYMSVHNARYRSVLNQSFQKMSVNNYFGATQSD